MNDTASFEFTADELAEIRRIQQTLLDLPRERTQAAVRSALTATRKLIGSDGAFAFYFFNGTPIFIADGLGDQIEAYLFEHWRGFDEEGYFVFDDEVLEGVNRLRRSFGSGVYHEAKLGNREFIENTRFFREAFEPAGMTCATGLTVRLPVGEAVFAFKVAATGAPRDVERTDALLNLLLPTFEAGFSALYDHSADAASIMPTLQALPFPAAIVSTDGRVAFTNERAQRDPDLLGIASLGSVGGAPTADAGVFRMPGPVLEGTRPSQIFIALVDEQAVDIETAAARFKLTPRQTEVARMMLRGLTDKQIAQELGISLHTARRHAETVLDRLGVSSRASVLLALLEASQIRVA
jgi:DNA-binding CsgD family transcriptional regulator